MEKKLQGHKKDQRALEVQRPDAMLYHDLRHGATSLVGTQKMSAWVAMEIMGHAQISANMNIYIHIPPELQKEATENAAGAL